MNKYRSKQTVDSDQHMLNLVCVDHIIDSFIRSCF